MTSPHVVHIKKGKSNQFAVTFNNETVIIGMEGFHIFSNGDILELYEFMGLQGLSILMVDGLYNTDILGDSGKYILYKVENELGEMLHG